MWRRKCKRAKLLSQKGIQNSNEEAASKNEKEIGKIVWMTILAHPCHGRQM